MKKNLRWRLLTVVGLSGVSAGAAAGSFTTLDGAQNGFMGALSRDGRIATGAYVSFGSYSGSWIWRDGADAVNMPLGAVLGMNSWGQPIAGSADDGSGTQVAALAYSDVDTAGPLLIGGYPGSVPMDNFLSQAYGVSDNGIAVGLAYDASGNPIAFRWTQADGMSRLPVERPDTFSRANGISRNGNLVFGWNDRSDGYRSGVIWLDGSPLALHNYGPYGDAFGSPPGEALAGSDDGSVVVGLNYWDDQLLSEAWRWTQATGVQPIGIITPPEPQTRKTLPTIALPMLANPAQRNQLWPQPSGGWDTSPSSTATAVSGDGNVVVGYTGPPTNTDAFIWTSAGGMVLLKDYAAAQGVTLPDGFLLYGATAISHDGLTIGGTGIDYAAGVMVPWVLDLHGASESVTVSVVGAVSANDLASGPFAGVPAGAAVTISFRVHSSGTSITPAHASDYAIDANSLSIKATWPDPGNGRVTVSDVSAAGANALLHLVNDQPRTDSIALDGAPLSTSGQSLRFAFADSSGSLFDSDQVARIDRSMVAGLFDSAQCSVGDGTASMDVALQWVSIGDGDGIFTDGFDGG